MRNWIFFLALLAAFPPLSIDMYLPAIPSLTRIWNQPLWVVNLTLVCFLATYSFFLLLYGPLSDRFGRRPLLKIGISIYILAGLLCAAAPNVEFLIAARMIQAAGAASAAALVLAITKDLFDFTVREKVLAYLGVVIALAPMLAPIAGGWILVAASWRAIFILLAAVGLAGLFGVHRMQETLSADQRNERVDLVNTYRHLVFNRAYAAMVLVFCLAVIPLFSFIAASSDIYITVLGLSEQIYGYFFGFNALALMGGAFCCTRISGRFPSQSIISFCFVGIALGGLLLVLVPHSGPWHLALPMFLISFSSGLSRPPSNNLVLRQVEQGAGAASSLLMFAFMTTGAVSMWFISLNWEDKVQVLGVLGVICGSAGFVLWRRVFKKWMPLPWQG